MTPAELLLLRASLLDRGAAHAAWCEFRATDAGIDDLEGDAFQLLPQLYCNLGQELSGDPACGRLKGIYRHAWYTNQRLLQLAARAVAQLHAAGIEVMLFDRAALAARLQGTGARPMETVDVLVHPQETERALAALTVLGWAGSESRFGRVVELTGENNATLRLHRSALSPTRYDKTLWSDAVSVSVCGVEALAPGPTDQLLLACTQGLGWTQAPLRWIPDAILVMRAGAGPCDWAGLAVRAREGEVTLQLADAIETLAAHFPHEFPGDRPAEMSRRRASPGERIIHRIKRTTPRRDPLSRLARRTAWAWEMRRRLALPAAPPDAPAAVSTAVGQSVEAEAGPRTFSAAELDNERLSAFRRLALESALAEILRLFDARGVQSLLLKGAAFARWLYDDPRERPYGDVDLLIHPDQFDIATRVLVDLHFELAEPHMSRRFSLATRIERSAYHERWVRRGALPAEVEIHHTLGIVSSQVSDPGASPALVWERMTEDVRVIEVGGARVEVPSPAVSALIVALHAAFHEGSHWPTPEGGPPPPTRDLHQAIARVDVATWRAAATLARDLGAGRAFAAGLRLHPAGRDLAARLG